MRSTISLPLVLALLFFLLIVRATATSENDVAVPPLATKPQQEEATTVTLANPESITDDASVKADDDSLRHINSEREQLQKKLRDISKLTARMNTKHALLRRVKKLRESVHHKMEVEDALRKEESEVAESVHSALLKKNATWDQKELIAQQRKKMEKLLRDIQNEKEQKELQILKVDGERKKTMARERELVAEQERLKQRLGELVTTFRDNGLHRWLEQNLASFPSVVQKTILKSSDALNPVVDGVESFAEFNKHLTDETTARINVYVPAIRNNPFYTGLIFYLIMLVPLVLATWLVLKVRARLVLMTVEHYLIAINLYFTVMSCLCVLLSIIAKHDILVVFRHRSQTKAEMFMIFNGLLFLVHLVLHGMTAYVSGARKDFAQYIVMSCIGLHFFLYAYKRTMLELDPTVGLPAYFVYAVVFSCTLYDRGIEVITAAVQDRKADTGAFGTYPTDENFTPTPSKKSPSGAHDEDKTVYFAGLPMYSAPTQTTLNDAKTI